MLGLTLRAEFRGKRLAGTAIELANANDTGATQIGADRFLEITYPTHDLLKAIEAVGPAQGRPVVVIGGRGAGKSHLLAVLYHAVSEPAATAAWLRSWSQNLGEPAMAAIQLREGMLVVGESLHRQRYKYLWDVLFNRHPHGDFIRGKWEGMGNAKTNVPSDELILELLRHTPTLLLLDEFQTWFDGLTDTRAAPYKTWAFNFIQILSEIAKEHPELLALVVSVRDGDTDAYQQIHRVNPIQIDFKAGGSPDRIQHDRRRMLLHRLFDNRLHVPEPNIEALIATHVAEYFRLLEVPNSEHDRRRRDFIEAWPFAPHLLQLLEDQVLVATEAQETRDLIRILANVFKSRGDAAPILTAADFRLEDESTGIGALLDSVANAQQRTLREKALRNITSVSEAVPNHRSLAPHLSEIMGALWLRSIAVGNMAGAEPATLQADITRTTRLDDNAIHEELSAIEDNSFNIHKEGSRLVFRQEENPQAKLMAYARNDRLFADGSDLARLAKEIRYSLGGSEEVARTSRVIALPRDWLSNPWQPLDENERPDGWDDRLTILVVPEEIDNIGPRLGEWLKVHLQRRRNTIRFLLPRAGSLPTYYDRNLLVLARAEMKAQEWTAQSPEYRKLHNRYQAELRDNLKKRFDRFAILSRWNFGNPSACTFSVERLSAVGDQIPTAIENAVNDDLFVPEDFEEFILLAAAETASLGKILRELQEPQVGGRDCIPWLGETRVKERVLRLCARGKLGVSLRGTEYLQAFPGEDEESAWRRLKPKLSVSGRHLEEVLLLDPSAVPQTGGSTPAAPPTSGSTSLFGNGVIETTAAPIRPEPTLTEGARPSPGGGDIFATTVARPTTNLRNPPTSPLNLIGKLEGWGIGPATPVSEVTIKVSAATGAQLRELLKKLPDGMTFELSLEKEDG